MFEKASEIRAAQREKLLRRAYEKGYKQGYEQGRKQAISQIRKLLRDAPRDPATGAVTITISLAEEAVLLGESPNGDA